VQQSKGALNQEKTTVLNMQGESACLPHKGTGPHTEECAFGLKVSNGTYYALSNLDVDKDHKTFETGKDLLVSGTLLSPAENEKYDVAGTIQVYAIKPKN